MIRTCSICGSGYDGVGNVCPSCDAALNKSPVEARSVPKISVERLTDWKLVAECARATVWKDPLPDGIEPSEMFKRRLLDCEHSPIRALVFKIRMDGIPTSASVHFVRHKFGVEHFVSSNRPDRNGGNTEITRESPVNHIMICNAQELIFMARRRLCGKAAPETRRVMDLIRSAVYAVDPAVARAMHPMCVYRHGCHEENSCGIWERTKEFYK